MNTLTYIQNKYGLEKGRSRYDLYRSRWGSLPLLIRDLKFRVGAEVGANTGRFSNFLYSYNPRLKLFAIDSWELESIYDKAKKRLASIRNFKLFKEEPVRAVKKFADKTLDFVFINNATDYKTAKENIQAWSGKVKKGGIIAGLGYENRLFTKTRGIKVAVDEWVRKNKIKPLFVFKKDSSPTWFYVKNA